MGTGGVGGFCGETGPAPAAGVGGVAGGVGVIDFKGITGAVGAAAIVGAATGSAGGRATGAAGVAGAAGGVGVSDVTALLCGGAAGRLAFRFRTPPPPSCRMPPETPGITFCGGVDAVGSGALSSAVGFGVVIISGVGGSVGRASAVNACVGAIGSETGMVGAVGANGVSLTGGLTTCFGWDFGSAWTLLTSCAAGGMMALCVVDASAGEWAAGPDLRPFFTRSFRIST
jgi:hypothetical protein